jgi:voltage-gated potassium channel
LVGDATRTVVLRDAGTAEASGIIVTTNDDGANVLLTLACRHLNPSARIVSRANRDDNVPELYSAGADFVVSRSSVGAALLMASLQGHESVVVTEGVSIFWQAVPGSLVGMSVGAVRAAEPVQAGVVALLRPDGEPLLDPADDTVLAAGSTLIMIGDAAAQAAFANRYGG